MVLLENRVWQETVNKNGTIMRIIEYHDANNIIVEFQDANKFKTHTTYQSFSNHCVFNPYDITAYGVGFVGYGIHKTSFDGKPTRKYQTWKDMLRRSYSIEYQLKKPTYSQVTVCEEWHNFQNFCDWYDENYYTVDGEKMHLDKDILSKGNKIYCSDKCAFVPEKINSIFVKNNINRGDLPIGVTIKNNKYNAICNNSILKNSKRSNIVKIGSYNDQISAFNAYKKYKERYIKEVAELYKEVIPNNVYNALLLYEININD